MSADAPVTWWRLSILRDQIVPVVPVRETALCVFTKIGASPERRLLKYTDAFPSYEAAFAHLRDQRWETMQNARERLARAEADFAALEALRTPPEVPRG